MTDIGFCHIGIFSLKLQILTTNKFVSKEKYAMKATGIVRRIDDLGRVVIPKEIRRTLRIREGDRSLITLKPDYIFYNAIRE